MPDAAGTVDLVIEGATAITIDPERRVISDALLAIRGGRLVAVGERAGLAARFSTRDSIDARGMVAHPGLIDTHGHAAHSLMKTIGEHLGGVAWRDMADALEFEGTTEAWWHADGLLTALERLKFGTTLGMSMLGSAPRTDRPEFGARHAEGVAAVGVRTILGAGPARPPWPRRFAYWEDGVRTERLVSLDEVWAATRKLVRQCHGTASGRIHVWASASRFLAPSPYDPMFDAAQLEYAERQARGLRRIADDFGVGIHTHAYGGAVRYASETLGVLGPDVCLAHCQGLDEDEIRMLRDSGASVAYCPTARRVYSYKARCPVPELIDAGVPTAIATDGVSPDRSFDLFKDVRMAMTLQRLHFTDAGVLPPGKALEMVTIDAARALRLDRDLGSLEVGKKADVVLVNMRAPHLVPNVMPAHRLAYEATGHDVDTVIVDGQVLMRGRRVLSVDEGQVLRRAEAEAARAFERAGLTHLLESPPGFWGGSHYGKST